MDEVENQNCEEIYKLHKDFIEVKYRAFTAVNLNFNEIIQELEKRNKNEEQHIFERTNDEEMVDQTMAIHDYNDDIIQANVMVDVGEEIGTVVQTFSIPDQLSDGKYFELCNDLNTKQRDYLMHIVNSFKTKELPIFIS